MRTILLFICISVLAFANLPQINGGWTPVRNFGEVVLFVNMGTINSSDGITTVWAKLYYSSANVTLIKKIAFKNGGKEVSIIESARYHPDSGEYIKNNKFPYKWEKNKNKDTLGYNVWKFIK